MQKSIQYKNVFVAYNLVENNANNKEFLLFMHGFGCDHTIWQTLNQNLNLKQNKILIDFPPFGNSECPNTPWTIEDYVQIVEKILITELCEKVNIVCHSFGARVGIELAIQNPKINKLIFIAGAGIREDKIKTNLKIIAYKLKKILSKIKLYSKNKLLKFQSNEYSSLSPVMKKTFSNIVSYDQRKRLKLIKNQTLLLWAKDDKITTIKSAKIMNKKIKNAELFTFDCGGHFVFLAFPKNIAKAIEIFLNE